MKNHRILLITLLALVVTSCGYTQTNSQDEANPPSSQNTFSTPLPKPQSTLTKQPAMSPSPTPTTLDIQPPDLENATIAPREIVEKAKADLVKQFGITANEIRVVEARATTWPDASLGCPQSDSVYAQVLTPGYWILLESDGRQYPYHTDQADQLILCLRNPSNSETERPPLPIIPVNPTEIKDGEPWVPVN